MNEPAADFDFEAVDCPESVALDELTTMAARMFPKLHITMEHAKLALAWAASLGCGPSNPVLEVSALWLGGCLEDKDVPLRAGVFIREFAPHARQAHSLRRLAAYHQASRQTVSRLSYGLRAAFGISGVGKYAASGWVPRGQRNLLDDPSHVRASASATNSALFAKTPT